jgi:hypothetical protein
MVAWATIDNYGLVEQLVQILTRYRVGVRNNLIGFKTVAQAQAAPVEQLADQANKQADLVLDKVAKINAVVQDPAARAELDDGLQRAGYARADLAPRVIDLRDAAQALKAAPKTSYAELIAACDGFLTAIPPRRSFWPE